MLVLKLNKFEIYSKSAIANSSIVLSGAGFVALVSASHKDLAFYDSAAEVHKTALSQILAK